MFLITQWILTGKSLIVFEAPLFVQQGGLADMTYFDSLEHNVYMHGPDGYGAGVYGGMGGMYGSVAPLEQIPCDGTGADLRVLFCS